MVLQHFVHSPFRQRPKIISMMGEELSLVRGSDLAQLGEMVSARLRDP